MISDDIWDACEPVIAQVAAEYGRRHRVHGAEPSDFQQELRIWVLEHEEKVAEWFDPELTDPSRGLKMLATALRNESKDYGLDIKAQATGYERSDLYFYTKNEVKDLLPAVFDPEKWLHPPQSEGRSAKSQAEGGNWVSTLADVARAYQLLPSDDKDVLDGFHRKGWTNKMMARYKDISESLMSYYHDRAVNRLVKILGDTKPSPMRRQSDRDPWRGRRAVSNARAQAINGGTYE